MNSIFINIVFILTSAIEIFCSKSVYYNLHIQYVSGSPDGVFKPKILTVNGHFPGPTIEADVGTTLHVNVRNEIQDFQNVTVHWHGIHHSLTPFEDGANQINQCPLKYGGKQTYIFHLDQAGTYWYHSHVMSQYTEGLWGALIVHNKEERYEYDEEIVIMLNDWYHRTALENEYWYLSFLSKGVAPYPDSAMLNGLGRYPCPFAHKRSFSKNCSALEQRRYVFEVKQQKRYRIRVINTSSQGAFRFSIDGHKLHTIEVDGVDVLKPVTVDMAILTSAQRYSFLVHMDESLGDYLIRASLMSEYLMLIERENINPYPEALMPNVTAVLRYNNAIPTDDVSLRQDHTSTEPFDYTQEIPPMDNLDYIILEEQLLQPADGINAPAYFDVEFVLEVSYSMDNKGIIHPALNSTPFSLPEYPMILSVIKDEPLPEHTNPLYVKYGEVVQIVVNNPFKGHHPFHLHGHQFWVVGSGIPSDGSYISESHKLKLDGVKRDTFTVNGNSWSVIRFVADNPGVWSFHCHNDWHHIMGMVMTIIEAPEILRQYYSIPDETIRVCSLQGIDVLGH